MYGIYILCFLIIFLVIILGKQMKERGININTFATIILTIIILYFILSPDQCIKASIKGADLFVNSILPSLFPFMVICNMLMHFNGINIYSKIIGPIICKPLRLSKASSFAIVASFICGYPLGAKYSTDLYENKYIGHEEYSRLLNIASNAGPLFIIGAIGSSMLGNATFGYIILAANYISAIIIGILTIKKRSPLSSELPPMIDKKEKNIGEILKLSITDALTGTLTVGGYVIFFSLLITIIKDNNLSKMLFNYNIENFESIKGILLGSIDLTNGANLIATSQLDLTLKLCILSFICSFGSFSVLAQVNSFVYKHNISMIKYLLFKILQGVISVIICYIICLFTLNSIETFNTGVTLTSFSYFIPTLIILVLSSIFLLLDKLFHLS
ncbi:sporulation integral membrane protein YlbJ [Clostridium fallax]|uniref:Sporulation integral membrane protein YlbJ n=1 Tax=Clostridium fallax TaxID=1533 RepID=A0A1M4UV76_9CLOT|nr:sporulation integral membrane protein YlbJ [Clostridium fallax]SHE60585.1 sporulation integral membrane protein YlbJ [Clostridium fallax]SQB06870.1 sporulation integral membrane protein YlbJ [Clostridium fallax]